MPLLFCTFYNLYFTGEHARSCSRKAVQEHATPFLPSLTQEHGHTGFKSITIFFLKDTVRKCKLFVENQSFLVTFPLLTVYKILTILGI